jgi:uncharacterized membrane-anchored protein
MPEAILRWLDLGVFEWLKARERKILLITVAAQLLILVGMIALRSVPLVTGQTVLVRVRPVDPRDLFRGDYVILSYDFSTMPQDGVQGLSAEQRGRWSKMKGMTVYVPLVADSIPGHMRAEKVTINKPLSGPFLRGQLGDYGRIKFGIEAYYVQEGTGRRYEEAIRERKLSAELAVSPSGQAVLKGLRID